MRSRIPTNRSTMLMGVSALALCLTAAGAANAQDAKAEDAETVDELVVTGQRAAIQSAQAIKRDSEQIVDSITAVDIGALPDRSVTEALQRVVGVTIGRTPEPRDADRLAVEGSGVAVRGLSWVRAELNGRDSFTAKSGRGLSFEDVPPELMAGIDVYKNPSADIIEGGLGGTVNLRTRMPFDSSKRVLAFSADYTYGDLIKDGDYSASFLYSDRWDTSIGEIGFLVSVADSTLVSRTDTIGVSPYIARNGAELGTTGTVYVPNALSWRSLDWERKRKGYSAALQWRPNDNLEIYGQYFRSEADQDSKEHAAWSNAGNTSIFPAAGTSFTYDSNRDFISGSLVDCNGCTSFGLGVDTRFASRHSVTSDYSVGFKWDGGGQWAFSGDLQYVEAATDALDFTVFDRVNVPSLTMDLTGGTPKVAIGPASYTADQANYYWSAAMDHLDDNDASEWAGRLDASYDFGENEWLRSFKFGVRYTDRESTTRESTWNWGVLSETWAGGIAPLNTTIPDQSEFWSFENYFRGDVNLPTGLWFPKNSLVADYAGAPAILAPAKRVPWGWSPFSGDYNAVDGGVNEQGEKTYASYGLLKFGNDAGFFGMPLDGNVGVRVVKTEAASSGVYKTPNAITGATAADARAQTLITFSDGAKYPLSSSTDYTDVLPSLNLRVKITPELQWRFAAAKSIVRPDFSQLEAYTTLGGSYSIDQTTGVLSINPAGLQSANSIGTGVGGNPDLKPMRSDQFDTSLEWYFAPSGSLTATVFYKKVYDYITTATFLETYTNNGVTAQFEVKRPVNGEEGSIKGIELAYQQFYDFLPGAFSGLGVQANVTILDNEGGANTSPSPYDGTAQANAARDLPLEGLSEKSFNVALMYEKYGISARIAYNWRNRYLLSASAANINIPVWADDFGQTDASIFYTVNDHIKVGIQGVNILNERTKILMTGESGRLNMHNWVDTDRRYAFVLRGTF